MTALDVDGVCSPPQSPNWVLPTYTPFSAYAGLTGGFYSYEYGKHCMWEIAECYRLWLHSAHAGVYCHSLLLDWVMHTRMLPSVHVRNTGSSSFKCKFQFENFVGINLKCKIFLQAENSCWGLLFPWCTNMRIPHTNTKFNFNFKV